jgi:hypothetical protein
VVGGWRQARGHGPGAQGPGEPGAAPARSGEVTTTGSRRGRWRLGAVAEAIAVCGRLARAGISKQDKGGKEKGARTVSKLSHPVFKPKLNAHSMCAQESSLHTYRTENGYRITNVIIYSIFTK